MKVVSSQKHQKFFCGQPKLPWHKVPNQQRALRDATRVHWSQHPAIVLAMAVQKSHPDIPFVKASHPEMCPVQEALPHTSPTVTLCLLPSARHPQG